MLTLALLVLALAAPDILAPGQRAIVHELVLEAPPELASWRFVAAPYPGLRGATAIELGVPFRFSRKYGTRIWALRPGESAPAGFSEEWARGRPVGAIPVSQVASVLLASPLTHVLTTCRVVAVSESDVRLERVDEERTHALLPLFFAVAAVGVAGLVVLRLVRRRRQAPTA